MRKTWIAGALLLPPLAYATAYTPDKFAASAYEKAKAAGADGANPKAGDATAIAAGKALFEQQCIACHGATGQGDGVASVALDPKPANFADPGRWSFTTPGVKHWIVMNGVKGTGMAPLGLTDDLAWSVLAYVQAAFEPGNAASGGH